MHVAPRKSIMPKPEYTMTCYTCGKDFITMMNTTPQNCNYCAEKEFYESESSRDIYAQRTGY